LKSGAAVEIHEGNPESRHVVLEAYSEGKRIAERHAQAGKDGSYALFSDHTEFDMFSQQSRTVVDVPNEGLGSRLIALVLKEIVRRKGTEARLEGIENARWAKHLQGKLGAQLSNDFYPLKSAVWTKEQLTLRTPQPWHDYLDYRKP